MLVRIYSPPRLPTYQARVQQVVGRIVSATCGALAPWKQLPCGKDWILATPSKPESLTPISHTLKPQLQTENPKPQAPIPRPKILYPTPQTLIPEPNAPSPEPQTPNPKPQIPTNQAQNYKSNQTNSQTERSRMEGRATSSGFPRLCSDLFIKSCEHVFITCLTPKCFPSRFAEVNSPINSSTFPSLLLI